MCLSFMSCDLSLHALNTRSILFLRAASANPSKKCERREGQSSRSLRRDPIIYVVAHIYPLMNQGPQRLTVDAARQLTFKATAPVRTTEEHLYDLCCKRIRQEAANGALQATCTVPQFIFGLPLFNRRIMRDRTALRFEREGWMVSCHGQEGIIIGWGPGAKCKVGVGRKSAGASNGQAARVRR